MKRGIVRKIDPLGRVVIPKEVRDRIGMTSGTPIEIDWTGNMVIITKPITDLQKRALRFLSQNHDNINALMEAKDGIGFDGDIASAIIEMIGGTP